MAKADSKVLRVRRARIKSVDAFPLASQATYNVE